MGPKLNVDPVRHHMVIGQWKILSNTLTKWHKGGRSERKEGNHSKTYLGIPVFLIVHSDLVHQKQLYQLVQGE